MTAQTLSDWIEPAHLTESSLHAHCSGFRNDPYRLLVIKNFLQQERARQLLHYLAEEASYEPFHALKKEHNCAGTPTRGAHVTADQWWSAAPEQRLFRLELARFPAATTAAAKAFLDCIEVVEGSSFGWFLARVVGEALGPIGFEAHRMQAGDFVGLHTDDRAARRLGFIIYLSQSWDELEGGMLVFEGHEGSRRTFLPEFNCFIVFDVAGHVGHRVEPVVGGQPRLSLHGWCLSPQPDAA
jgi:2OG-Fe(II) oxygenase superfamily